MTRDNIMKHFYRVIEEGERLPAWYGVAWRRWNGQSVCMVMPLNALVRCVRAIIIWIRFGGCEVPVNPRDAYLQGYRDGRKSVFLFSEVSDEKMEKEGRHEP